MNPIHPFAPRRGSPIPTSNFAHGRRLAVDPGAQGGASRVAGTNTGWALFNTTGFLIACGTGEPPCGGVSRLVIEVPQAYKPGRLKHAIDPGDLIALAFFAGRLVGRVQAGQMPVEAAWVWPHQWKGDLPKEVCENRTKRKLNTTEQAVVAECERNVPGGLMNNVFDAIGLGLWAWRP